MSKVNVSIEELFELGAHFGHRKRFWNPHMEDYIFCEKNNIQLLWGIGGDNKSNSSSWILQKWKQDN